MAPTVHLQVGERKFTTTRETLVSKSGFFAALLSDRWHNALDDGPHFIDAEPKLFEQILRYLRRGVYPLFFDAAKGHDEHLYLSILEEARYFDIPCLQNWLEEKQYMQAVKLHQAVSYEEGDGFYHRANPANAMVDYYPSFKMKRVYVCPRGIARHRGQPEACG